MNRTFFSWLLTPLLLLSGCAGSTMFTAYPRRIAPYLASVSAGNPVDMGKALRSEVNGSNGTLYRMERGRLAMIQGDIAASRSDFEKAIDSIRAGDDRAVLSAGTAGSEVASWLLNDNARRYEPDGYERVLLHHFQALDYLFAGDLEGAGVEVRLANAEQEEAARRHAADIDTAERAANENRVGTGRIRGLESGFSGMDDAAARVRNSFQNAYTFYLSGVVYEAMGQPNDAYIDYRKALEIFPTNRTLQLDALRLAESLGMQDDFDEMRFRFRIPEGATFRSGDPDSGDLVVFYEDGFVPPKEEVKFPVPLPGGGIGAIAFPIYRYDWAPPAPLFVARPNVVTWSTEPIAYIDAMAVSALKEKIPGIVIRHLIRTGGKALAAKAAGRSGRDAAAVAELAVDLWNILSENADLRSWVSLPRDAQVLRIQLPAGRHVLALRRGDEASEKVEVEIRRGGITLLHVAGIGSVKHVKTAVLGGSASAPVAVEPVR